MPQYVQVAIGFPFAATPFAIFLPAPKITGRRGFLALVSMAGLGLSLSLLCLPMILLGVFTPAMLTMALGLTMWVVALWLAGKPHIRGPLEAIASEGDEDDDNGGGGGGPKRPTPPERSPSPDGMGFDWGLFDTERAGWRPKGKPMRKPDFDRTPERKPEFV